MGQKCWIENLPVDEECIIVWGQFHCFCSSSPPCQNKKRLLEWILYGNAIDNEISWCWGCCSSAAAIWWKHCQSHIQESWVLLPKKLLSRLKQATNNLTPTLTVKMLNIKQLSILPSCQLHLAITIAFINTSTNNFWAIFGHLETWIGAWKWQK